MKAKVLDVYQGQNFNKEVQYIMVVLANFQDFDNVIPSTQKIELTIEQFTKYKAEKGKDVNIDVVFPVSKYPLALAS